MSQIQTIDIGPLFTSDITAKLNVARQIDAVCRGTGFFVISNHGIDNLDGLTQEAFRFFKGQTTEQKLKLAPNKWNPANKNTYRGYFPSSVNGKEGLDIGNPGFNSEHELVKKQYPMHDVLIWPDEDLLPGFRQYCENLFEKMTNLARAVLSGFALAAGKEETFFNDKVKTEDCLSTLRLNYYPFLDNIEAVEVSKDGTRLGCETHRDGSLITILYQPIKGLQIENGDGWIDVQPSNANFVVNTGLCMNRWTNGVYQAANHRVKHVNVERISVPYFAEPRFDCVINSFTPQKPDEQSKYEPIKYGDYITESNKSFKEYQR